jgi:hypothetical protein
MQRRRLDVGDLAVVSANMSGRLVPGFEFTTREHLFADPPRARTTLTGAHLDSVLSAIPEGSPSYTPAILTHHLWAVWSVVHRFEAGETVIITHGPALVSNKRTRLDLGMRPLSTLTEVLCAETGRCVWLKSGSLRPPK